MAFKIPVSVLVVVYTPALDVLVMERASRPGFWQSVTGSLDAEHEPLEHAARRELEEETGIDPDSGELTRWSLVNTFEIFALWRNRYAPGTRYNTEHVFGFVVPQRPAVRLAPDEHVAFEWMDWESAARRCFSWSNRDAIRLLGQRSTLISPGPRDGATLRPGAA